MRLVAFPVILLQRREGEKKEKKGGGKGKRERGRGGEKKEKGKNAGQRSPAADIAKK